MVTEVLLMTDVVDVGAEGAVVRVADGFARNYLFPNDLAAPVTEATRRRLEKKRRESEALRKVQLEEAKQLAARLAGVSCTIPSKTSEGEKLYGSVTVAEILKSLSAQGITLDASCVKLEKPIKELGVFQVDVKLHPDVMTTVKVWVVEE